MLAFVLGCLLGLQKPTGVQHGASATSSVNSLHKEWMQDLIVVEGVVFEACSILRVPK